MLVERLEYRIVRSLFWYVSSATSMYVHFHEGVYVFLCLCVMYIIAESARENMKMQKVDCE